MPGGRYDSSRTRVGPFFDYLYEQDPSGQSWLPGLLGLPVGGSEPPPATSVDDPLEVAWWPRERGLPAPPSLLAWLVRNLKCPSSMRESQIRPERRDLIRGDPSRIQEGLDQLETSDAERAWWVMEGPSYPDAYLATSDLVVVVEGKRTEAGPTSSTTWMPIRHQILRHLDAALGPAGPRRLLGFFMVEGRADGSVPDLWMEASARTLEPQALEASLPHRSEEERNYLADCFLGVTTWQLACEALGVPWDQLPESVAG